MNARLSSLRQFAWWIAPVVAIAALVAVRIDSAHGAAAGADASPAPPATPLAPSLLPDYAMGGGVETRSETVNRTLFNPTRRPAPAAVQEAAKPQMARGQFVLAGTTVVDGKATAFLREVKTGKFRRVAQGENLNGLTVAEVKPDRVKLTMGDESEDLSLKVVPNPRPTPGAPPPAAVVAGAPPGAAPPGPAPGVPGAGPTAPQTPEQAAQALLERRRAARAAAEGAPAANNAASGAAAPPPPGTATPQSGATAQGSSQTTWADVFRRYQERSGSVTGR